MSEEKNALEFSIDGVSDFVWRCLACLLGLFVFAGTDLAHPFRNIRIFFLFSFGMLAWQKNPSQAVAGQRRSPSDRKDMRYEKIKVRPIQNRSPFLFIEFCEGSCENYGSFRKLFHTLSHVAGNSRASPSWCWCKLECADSR